MPGWTYRKGLHEIGEGIFAWLQPDGSWGWSNAGLVTFGGQSLLVDTLFDLKLTAEMLAEMKKATPAASHIATVVNTHANGDHCYGNQLVAGAEIISSRRSAEEMAEMPPAKMARLLKVANLATSLGGIARGLAKLLRMAGAEAGAGFIEAGPYVSRVFGPFTFDDITYTPPTRTFEGELSLMVGDRPIQLIEVGPAHTRGDTLVYLPADKVVFTGDILFIKGHPVMWEGPIQNWINACDRLLALDVEVIVPGHGPITDKQGVRDVKNYLQYLQREALTAFQEGLTPYEAARRLSLSEFQGWLDPERVVLNMQTLFRELRGDTHHPPPGPLFGEMGPLRADWGL